MCKTGHESKADVRENVREHAGSRTITLQMSTGKADGDGGKRSTAKRTRMGDERGVTENVCRAERACANVCDEAQDGAAKPLARPQQTLMRGSGAQNKHARTHHAPNCPHELRAPQPLNRHRHRPGNHYPLVFVVIVALIFVVIVLVVIVALVFVAIVGVVIAALSFVVIVVIVFVVIVAIVLVAIVGVVIPALSFVVIVVTVFVVIVVIIEAIKRNPLLPTTEYSRPIRIRPYNPIRTCVRADRAPPLQRMCVALSAESAESNPDTCVRADPKHPDMLQRKKRFRSA